MEPTPKAKFVEFTTLLAPNQIPGQRRPVLDWPYTEGLRLDEAMNPLTMLAVGLYGEVLPNQNGAPIRLVVPWKYGFKSIKSIVRIRLVDRQPKTAWEKSQPNEYGFYSNVNPEVDHPRWSQARERRIGEFLKRPTLMFNGYGDQVASMYAGMDLRKNSLSEAEAEIDLRQSPDAPETLPPEGPVFLACLAPVAWLAWAAVGGVLARTRSARSRKRPAPGRCASWCSRWRSPRAQADRLERCWSATGACWACSRSSTARCTS